MMLMQDALTRYCNEIGGKHDFNISELPYQGLSR